MIYKKKMYRGGTQSRRAQQPRCPMSCADTPPYTVTLNSKTPSLAAVYGIKQEWRGIDDSGTGFERGTIFNELDKPFMGDKCKNGGFCK